MSVPGRLVLLVTTHRVAAGLLSWQAWDVLRRADAVLVAAATHPLLPALATADVEAREVGGGPAEQARAALVAASGATAVWLVSPEGDPELMDELTAQLSGQASGTGAQLPEIELLPGSWDLPGSRLLDVVAVMDRLRSPGGCPWDARQTHTSLVEYLLEEAYETVEAIETAGDPELREELGDLLLQVLFHSRIAQEREDRPWSVDDVAAGIVDKLISRHPHVFGDTDLETAEQVEASWHSLKQAEKGRESVTDGIPLALPALVLATKLLTRAARGGVAVPLPPARPPDVADAEELGDLLLALVAVAGARGWDAEASLRAAVRRHRASIRAAEGLPS